VGQKTGLFLRSHNFATTDDRKACNMSKVSEFCLYNEMYNLHVSAIKYSLPNLHKSSVPPKMAEMTLKN